MFTRLFGVVILAALLGLAVLAAPAVAAENGLPRDLPDIDEVVADSDRAREHLPEEAERQPFQEALIYPLMAVGLLAILVIGVLYLKWQPDFERQDSKRR